MNIYKRQAFGNGPFFSGIFWQKFSIICLVFLGLITGCTPASDDLPPPLEERPAQIIIQDGIVIPRFATAADQLNHAKSGLSNKKQKGAAFRAVLSLFPQNRTECGHATLGLAFLHLEPDYRFAKPIDIRKATNDFIAVLKEFQGIEEVQAKAHWYLGWIYCNLHLTPETGNNHLWTVVRDYPQVPMNLATPMPWINLAHPEEFPTIKQSVPIKYWAQAALLEIVRHPYNKGDMLKAFDLLYSRFFDSIETGFAIKTMLTRTELAGVIKPRAFTWISRNSSNPYLVRDISVLAGGRR